MWKFVVRGIRETLERRACRTNIYSQSSQDNTKNEVKTSLTCQQKFLPPIVVSFDNGFCGSAKSTGAKDKKHHWNTRHTWSEAFSWSSALAAGWVVCQTLCLHKRRIFDRDNKENLKHKCCGSSFLAHILNLQPRNILPVTNCVGNGDNGSSLQDSDSWNAGKPFGPITIEEAFEEAATEFTKAHNAIVGEYEFRYGIEALEEKRYKDALMHFSAGAKLSSPRSMFNLGLCYELGIGTSVDQKEAAKYYTDAAAHDHADALYNLGVFHAQGRGGLPIDIDAARTYFTRAAKLGQKQAQHALDLEKAKPSSKKKATVSAIPHIDTTLLKLVNSALSTKFLANYTLSSFPSTSAQKPCTIETSEKYNENVMQDPTQVFLDFLGVGKPPSQPPISLTTNCHVPC